MKEYLNALHFARIRLSFLPRAGSNNTRDLFLGEGGTLDRSIKKEGNARFYPIKLAMLLS